MDNIGQRTPSSTNAQLGGVVVNDDAAVPIREVVVHRHLKENLSLIFAKCFLYCYPQVNRNLAAMLVVPLSRERPSPQVFHIKIENVSGLVLIPNIEVLLDNSQSTKAIILSALMAKEWAVSPERFTFQDEAGNTINLEEMNFNELTTGDKVTLRAVAVIFSPEKKAAIIAVSQEGSALQYACAELKADRDVVLAAVRQNGRALQYANKTLRANRDMVLTAVTQCGHALEFASELLTADRGVVLVAVSHCGYALRFVSEELRADRELVLTAVSNYGWALNYASSELKADREVVLAAVTNHSYSLDHASAELRADREILLAAGLSYCSCCLIS